MRRESQKADMIASATLIAAKHCDPVGLGLLNTYKIECVGPDGNIKWVETIHNEVVTEGLNNILDVYFRGTAQDTTWFVGLTDGTPTTAPGDTLASHAGWVEISDYAGTRKVLTLDAAAAGLTDNVGNEASFAIDATVTVGGCFVAGVDTGSASILYGVGAFTGGDKAVANGDTLNVTVTLTAATV